MTTPAYGADIVALIGSPCVGSRTRALADATAEALAAVLTAAGVEINGVRTLELAEIAAVSFGAGTAIPLRPVDSPHDIVRSAKLLVVATPTYKGTYTGLLKVFLDRYGQRELGGIVAAPVAIAATSEHRESVARSLRELLLELGAYVPANTLAVLEQDLDNPRVLAGAWVARHGRSFTNLFQPAAGRSGHCVDGQRAGPA